MSYIAMKQLLEAGVHFGHETKRWNPKFKRYIFAERNGIFIIDLQKTLKQIDRSFDFIKATAEKGGVILFVGTKKQAQEIVELEARRTGMPFVTQRWLGGMLTAPSAPALTASPRSMCCSRPEKSICASRPSAWRWAKSVTVSSASWAESAP